MSAQAEAVAVKQCGACSSCQPTGLSGLTRLGVKAGGADYVVALAGNPNTGKSTLFNALTGLRQHVGNWAGKTVARAEGSFRFNGRQYKIIDLPGTYSLLSTSADEEVARDFVLFGQPDVTIIVADANRLERNLGLVLQVLEITERAVVALNLVDEARRNHVTVDARALARELGVPVVPMVARSGEGVPELLSAIETTAQSPSSASPRRLEFADAALRQAVEELTAQLQEVFPTLPNVRWVALRLLEGDESIARAVREGTLGELGHAEAPADHLPLAVR